MTDEELCKALRNAKVTQDFRHTLEDEAADRIEALVKERDEWKSLAEAVIADDASKNIHYAEVQHRAEAAEAALKAVDPAAIREAALREAAELFGDSVTGRAVARCILALINKKEGAPTEYERKVAQMKEDFPNGI